MIGKLKSKLLLGSLIGFTFASTSIGGIFYYLNSAANTNHILEAKREVELTQNVIAIRSFELILNSRKSISNWDLEQFKELTIARVKESTVI